MATNPDPLSTHGACGSPVARAIPVLRRPTWHVAHDPLAAGIRNAYGQTERLGWRRRLMMCTRLDSKTWLPARRLVCLLACPMCVGACGTLPSDLNPGEAPEPRPSDQIDPIVAGPDHPFDGTWLVDATFDSGQRIGGTVGFTVEVRNGIPECMRPNGPGNSPRLTDLQRPITNEGGAALIRFTADFAPWDPLDGLNPFEENADQDVVEIILIAREITRNEQLFPVIQYDTIIEQRFLLSDEVLFSTGVVKQHTVAGQGVLPDGSTKSADPTLCEQER